VRAHRGLRGRRERLTVGGQENQDVGFSGDDGIDLGRLRGGIGWPLRTLRGDVAEPLGFFARVLDDGGEPAMVPTGALKAIFYGPTRRDFSAPVVSSCASLPAARGDSVGAGFEDSAPELTTGGERERDEHGGQARDDMGIGKHDVSLARVVLLARWFSRSGSWTPLRARDFALHEHGGEYDGAFDVFAESRWAYREA